MNQQQDLARYAAIFAADAGTDALYYGDRYTDDMADLCLSVAAEAISRREAAEIAGKDFYACAFVEAAAFALNSCHAASLDQLLEAGQIESDLIAKGGAA